MKKLFFAALACLLLLGGCGGKSAEESALEMQSQLAAADAYSAEVKVSIPREEETLRYAFSLSHEEGETVLTLREPEMLSGLGAKLTEGDLFLSYDGLVLDAGTAAERVSAANCAPLLLRALAQGYILRAAWEDGLLYVVSESECSGEVLNYRAYLSPDGVPLYGEIEKNQQIIAFMEFTNFASYDTIASNDNAA